MRTVASICRELLPDTRTDGELIAAFAAGRAEPTFLELVRRHGPLVWGVCRRVLPHPSDAEDAFQATFLVLVRQAHKLTGRDALGPWLHRVAVWTARNVRRKNARRLARQRELPDGVSVPAPDADLRTDIDGALQSLPARYRDPIVLCHLQGFTRREAAARLGCAEGTLSAWLNRGLAKLRARLCDRDPARALGTATVAVPAALATRTAHAAVATGVAATVPPAVSSIVEGVLHMLWIKKATATTVALCAVFALGVGTGLGTRPAYMGAEAQDGPPKAGTGTKTVPAAAPDREREIAELERQIQLLESLRFQLMRNREPRDPEKRDGQNKPATKPAPEKLDPNAKIQDALDASSAELKALQDKLVKLKGAKPAPVADAKPNRNELQHELVELELLKREVAQLEDQKRALLAKTKAAQQLAAQLAETEARLQNMKLRAAFLTARAEQSKPAAAAAGYLELTVSPKAGGAEFMIREVPAKDPKSGALGKRALGPITTGDPAALAVLLARAKNDPNGPQEILFTATEGVPPELLRAALEACKSAKFQQLTVKEPSTTKGGLGTLKRDKPESPKPESDFKSGIEEGLKRRDQELKEARERQTALEEKLKGEIEERLKKRDPKPLKP